MMTLIEIQRASSSWKLRQLYVQGPVLTVHNETLWHDQSDGDFRLSRAKEELRYIIEHNGELPPAKEQPVIAHGRMPAPGP